MSVLAALAKRFASLGISVLERGAARDFQHVGRGVHDLSSTAATTGSLLRPNFVPLLSRKLQYPSPVVPPREAWLETLSTIENQKLGLIDLHPDVFAAYPRIDVLHANVQWQRNFKRISYAKVKTKAEVRGGGRKPWPQKGLGKARHGSIRSPLWRGGGRAKGPRGPLSYFYMLPLPLRVMGLRVGLSAKYAQNYLHIVDSLEIPTDEPKYLEELINSRGWGDSVLFVDESDIAPRNFALATSKIPEYNVMPFYGLNVYSMLKHECLVLTLAAVERLEERLLHHMHSVEKPK